MNKEKFGAGNIVNRIGNSIRNAVTKIKSTFTSQKSFIVNDDIAVALKQSTINEKNNNGNSNNYTTNLKTHKVDENVPSPGYILNFKNKIIKKKKTSNCTNSCDSGSKPNGLFNSNKIMPSLGLKIFVLLLSLLLIATPALALKQLVSLQGKITLNGALVDDGNISVTIWDSATDGKVIYNSSEYFNNSVQSGFFDVMLGSNKDLDINLSATYYLDFQVNDVDLDKGGDERIQFQSPVGYKVSGTDNFTVDTDVLYVDSLNDKVGVGITEPTSKLHVDGDLNVSGSVYSSGGNITTPATPLLSLLKANSGTTTTTTEENVDTIAISGLTQYDSLMIVYTAQSEDQTTFSPNIYSETDDVNITRLLYDGGQGNIPAGKNVTSTVMITQAQTSNKIIAASGALGQFGGRTVGGYSTFTTAWTGSWTLALRHNGVTSGGTFRWSWRVYKLAGQ